MIESYHLYLTASEVFFRRESGLLWWKKIEHLGQGKWSATSSISQIFNDLKLDNKYRKNLHVYVGSSLCKFMVVDLPPNLHKEQEQQLMLQAHMQHQLGLNGSEWNFTFDRVRQPQKAIVCAVRRNIMAQLDNFTLEKKLKLVSLKPYVAGIWNVFQQAQKHQEKLALIAVESDAFSVMISQSGILESMSTLSHNKEHNLVEREIKRLNVSLGGDDRQEIYLALNTGLSNITHSNGGKVLFADEYLKKTLYADFRELSFCANAETES
jgi:hypothetical protein